MSKILVIILSTTKLIVLKNVSKYEKIRRMSDLWPKKKYYAIKIKLIPNQFEKLNNKTTIYKSKYIFHFIHNIQNSDNNAQ